jgi:hypothetical protein
MREVVWMEQSVVDRDIRFRLFESELLEYVHQWDQSDG